MSRTKLLIAYVLLVGLPLLALIGILRAGRRLAPPPSVAGPWNLQADLSSIPDAACRQMLASIGQPFVTITQSGENLSFNFNDPKKTLAAGTLQGSDLSLSPRRGLDGAGCAGAASIELHARVATESGQRVLTGLLTVEGSAAPFRADRWTPDAKQSP
jgi:hypothetical protein